MDSYARALFAYLIKTGATQDDVAAKIGVDRSNISRWLSGRSAVGKKYRAPISALTGYTPGEHCPLQTCCPVWQADKVSHTAAAVIETLNGMTPAQQRRLLSAAEKILAKSDPSDAVR